MSVSKPEKIMPSRIQRAVRAMCLCLALLLIAFAAVVIMSNGIAPCLVSRFDRQADRDPATGIVHGAEPRILGPENAKAAVLMVHGFLGGANNFANLPDQLATHGFRVNVMRLPGHGTSPHNLALIPPDVLINAVADEANLLRRNYAHVYLCGHSMGGTLCVLTTTQVPVDGLILLAPYFGVTTSPLYLLPPETWARIGAPLLPWLYKPACLIQVNRTETRKEIYSYRWTPTPAVQTLIELGQRARRPQTLDAIACPVLHIHSRHDRAADPNLARMAVDAMQHAPRKRSVSVDQSNHILCWDVDQETIFQEVADFLTDLDHKDASPHN